ncbi:MAG: fasciclin domain-containing protein [Longimonas sp.]|uniref:fasciclin domain-containing protein n=1 Tax=Longimonas sp. TaxID=2039626 RepID=UPI00335F77EC
MLHRLIRGSRLLSLALIFTLTLGLTACDSDDPVTPEPPEPDPEQTIGEIVGDSDDFATLFAALDAAGLADTFTDAEATFTVFAPNEAAFTPINTDVLLGQDEALASVLGYHVIEGQAIFADDLNEGENTVTTLSGDELTVEVTDDGVFIEGSEVIQTDIEAENGVIHVLDRALLGNQNLANVAWFVNETGSLYNAVVDAGLGEAFAGAEEWTVFGPNNEAFDSADLSGFSEDETQEILQYHALAGQTTDAASLLGLLESEGELELETLTGEAINVTLDGEQVVFNGGQATLDANNLDYFASNGILHVIDGLLLPEDLRPANTIANVVSQNDDFSTLLAALEEADLVDPLADEEATFTVFAPNNDGFAPINTDVLLAQPELGDVLGYHVIPDAAIRAADLNEGENTVTTLSGDELTVEVTNDGVFIEGSEVIQTDIEADNGVIHVLDRALLGNQNLANTAWFVDETLELYNTVVDFGLAEAFVDAESWTVFGPNNATFEAADLSGFSEEEIQEVLQYHVFAADAVDSASLLALLDDEGGEVELETAQGEPLTIALDGEQVVFNDGENGPQATLDANNLDYFASNGILHVIDGLLLPPSFAEDDSAVTITLDNDGASAYFATAVDGADAEAVVELNENNAPITLSVGTRYTFDIVNGGPHPFAIEDGNGTDLLTHAGEGTFADDSDVDLVTDGEGGFSFTLTQELANELGEYYCAVHTGSMRGTLNVE